MAPRSLPLDRPRRLGRDVIDTQKREDFKARMNETVHDMEFRTSNFSFQTAKSGRFLRPSLRANGSRECAPDDRLREAIHSPAVIASAAKQSIAPRKERMDCFAALAMTCRRVRTSRRDAPEALHEISRPKRAWGTPDARWHPRPRVHLVVVERTRVTTSTPESPGVPARNGFNGFLRALPGDRAFLPPSPADMSCLSPVGPT